MNKIACSVIIFSFLFLAACDSPGKGDEREDTGTRLPLEGEDYNVDSLPPDDTHVPIDGTETRDSL